ncbi:hypothetical protein K466DRAFT_539217 [Polyporus arcularius HHB13444]|uniref:Chromatin modification-related protein n=1 Tax=Polyporus arcularius HHB13444 TaxID=1314778 RepID=A0A5C3PWG0_9APHY|nr:hypothetical protein K466DRAFT_539217 [Polyporus arcularius HHB13444]
MSRRQTTMNYPSNSTSAVDTALSLAHLSEYAHTLDSLPIDLSRSYGDLRELDAVLSSSMTLLTAKINELVSMIETKTGTNDDRLYLLTEIAEEAGRLKLGGEDKIRVAGHAADGLRAHRTHMKALLDRIPDKEFSRVADALSRKTVYPHVATRNFYPPGMAGEGGRRNRRAAGAANGYGTGLLVNGGEPTPTKRKRVAKEDEIDVTRTPTKKDRLDAPAQRQRNGGKAKKVVERVASPTESILSVASHMPQNIPVQTSAGPSRQAAPGRAGSNGANKRAQETSRRDAFAAQPPPASHPSLPAPHLSGQIGILTDAHGARAMSNGVVSEWPHGQLEGPGMPVARNFQPVPADAHDGMSAEPDGDVDDNKTYCFCDGVSYGEMIGCDDEECEREWFHLACVGLAVAPEGGWICETCTALRHSSRKSGRGGKKRTAGRTAARGHPA